MQQRRLTIFTASLPTMQELQANNPSKDQCMLSCMLMFVDRPYKAEHTSHVVVCVSPLRLHWDVRI